MTLTLAGGCRSLALCVRNGQAVWCERRRADVQICCGEQEKEMMSEKGEWNGWGKERTYDETAFGGVDAAGLERL